MRLQLMAQASRTVLVAFLVFGLARPAVGAPLPLPAATVLASGGGPKLLVLVAPLDAVARGQAGLLEHVAETAVVAQGRFTLLRSADALDGRAARAREDAADKARQLDKSGRQKLDDLDAVAGAQQLTDALNAWRTSDLTQYFKEYVSTWSARGGAWASGDENAKARGDIDRILAIAADAQFSNAYYPPDHLKYAESVRKNVQSANGELTVRSEPVGARIWVDGTYRGVAPVTAKGLAPGKHLVTALLAGRSLWQSDVSLGDELVRLEPAEGAVHWSRTLTKLAAEPDGPGRDTAARELAAATGAEQVLLVVARKSVAGNQLELVALRIEAKDGHNAAWLQRTVPMDATEPVDQLVTALLAKDVPRPDGKTPVTHFKGGTGPGQTRKIIGYSAMGAGVLLIGTSVLFGSLALGKQAEYRSTLQVETLKAENIASQGRSFAVVCDITLFTGIAAAAAGAVIGFTTLGQPAAGGVEPAPAATKDKAEGVAENKDGERKDAEKRDVEKQPAKGKADDGKKKDVEQKKDEEEMKGKKGKKETKREEADRKKREAEEERKAKLEEEARAKEEEKKAKEEEKKAKEEEKKAKEEEKKTKEQEKKAREEEDRRRKEDDDKKKKEAADEARRAKEEGPSKKKDEEAKKKADEEARRREEEEGKKRTDEEKKKEEEKKKKAKEEEEKKKREEGEKKKDDKPKTDDHDDLRNY